MNANMNVIMHDTDICFLSGPCPHLLGAERGSVPPLLAAVSVEVVVVDGLWVALVR